MADEHPDPPDTTAPEADDPAAEDDDNMGVLSRWDMQNAREFADDPTEPS